jgi:anaerobic selenocysteine-containing dehydrogenase
MISCWGRFLNQKWTRSLTMMGEWGGYVKPGVLQTFCQNCHMKCRIFVTMQNGHIKNISNSIDIEGAKTVPAHEQVYHPDRLLYPQKRVGRRGEGKWQRLSWDDALGLMAEKFGRIKEEYGVEAIATIRG